MPQSIKYYTIEVNKKFIISKANDKQFLYVTAGDLLHNLGEYLHPCFLYITPSDYLPHDVCRLKRSCPHARAHA